MIAGALFWAAFILALLGVWLVAENPNVPWGGVLVAVALLVARRSGRGSRS